MTRSKRLGTQAETAVVAALRSVFPNAERRTLTGSSDRGDINAHPHLMIEVKNHRQINLAEFIDQTRTQADNAGAWLGVAWIKRRGKSDPAAWYVAMDGATFLQILTRLVRAGAL